MKTEININQNDVMDAWHDVTRGEAAAILQRIVSKDNLRIMVNKLRDQQPERIRAIHWVDTYCDSISNQHAYERMSNLDGDLEALKDMLTEHAKEDDVSLSYYYDLETNKLCLDVVVENIIIKAAAHAERTAMSMNDRAIEDAKNELELRGYYVENLWHVNDVKNRFDCTDEEAQEVLDDVLQNDWIMEQINVSIAEVGDANELKRYE